LTGLAARALYYDNDVQEGRPISLQMISGKIMSAIPTTVLYGTTNSEIVSFGQYMAPRWHHCLFFGPTHLE
jgi:hypothetical protein